MSGLLVMPSDWAIAQGGGGVGQEMKKLEKQTRKQGQGKARKKPKVDVNIKKKPAKAIPVAGAFTVFDLKIIGDAEFLEELGMKQSLFDEVVGKKVSNKEIIDIAKRYQERCVKAGYYLALIRKSPETDPKKGILALNVDKGRFGGMTFKFDEDPETKEKVKSYLSEKQLGKKLKALKEGSAFDYEEFYSAVFGLNSHPDITADVELNIDTRTVDGARQRYANMIFRVKDDLPLHGALEVNNTGTEATEEWRVGATFQHLNLTKHDDILTVNVGYSVDFVSMKSFASSYYIPYYAGNGGAFTLYGGYSEIDAENVAESIDVLGEGWFAGIQTSYKLLASRKHQLSVHGGAVYRSIQDNLVFKGQQAEGRDITILPVSLALSYASVRPDFMGGRNYVTLRSSYNLGDAAGGSDDAEISTVREEAEADYFIESVQLARVQPLFGSVNDKGVKVNRWILFVKADGQVSSGELIPAEQKAIGGVDTVRGYPERDLRGDTGVSGTVELRTPLIGGLWGWIPGVSSSAADRLQLVIFADGGWLESDESQIAETEAQTISSAGAGLRMSFSQYSQLKFDWGVPFEETDESESGGRAHVRFQLQF